MKYSKLVVSILVLLSVFSSGCLMATYQIMNDIESMKVSTLANMQVKEGLKMRLEEKM